MKIIVLYYSFTGNNAWLANAIADKMGCTSMEIRERAPRKKYSILFDLIFHRKSHLEECTVLLDTYDLVIFVAPIWASMIATPMATFLSAQKNNISNYAFVSFCGGVPNQDKKIILQLSSLLKKKPIAFAEVKVNDLLPPKQRNKIRYTTPYRVMRKDQPTLARWVDEFIHQIIDFEDTNLGFTQRNKSQATL